MPHPHDDARARSPGARASASQTRLDRLVRPEATPEALAALRITTGGFAGIYLAVRFRSFVSVALFSPSDFAPVGIARWLGQPIAPWLAIACVAACIAGAVPFVLGASFRFTGPLFAALFLWVTTYKSSFGFIFHTENLLALHIAVLASSDASAAWSIDARAGRIAEASPSFGWPVRLLSVVTVLSYVLAGVAKLRMTGISWVEGEVLREHLAFDTARKALLGHVASSAGAALVRNPHLLRPLSALTLFLELGAPLALLGRRPAMIFVALAVAFHAGVAVSMAIVFSYPLSGFAFASFLGPERLLSRWLGPKTTVPARVSDPN